MRLISSECFSWICDRDILGGKCALICFCANRRINEFAPEFRCLFKRKSEWLEFGARNRDEHKFWSKCRRIIGQSYDLNRTQSAWEIVRQVILFSFTITAINLQFVFVILLHCILRSVNNIPTHNHFAKHIENLSVSVVNLQSNSCFRRAPDRLSRQCTNSIILVDKLCG